MTAFNTRAAVALLALVVAAAPVGAALAGEGNGDPSGLENSQQPLTANPIETQTGAAHYQGFARNPTVAVIPGGVAPSTSNQSEPEPLNSLPSPPNAGGL